LQLQICGKHKEHFLFARFAPKFRDGKIKRKALLT